jgi:hypothetical protein
MLLTEVYFTHIVIFFTQYHRQQCILGYMCTSLKPWRGKSEVCLREQKWEKKKKMKTNQFDSEQFLKKMGERLEWAPNGCDVGNRRGGEKVETMREV